MSEGRDHALVHEELRAGGLGTSVSPRGRTVGWDGRPRWYRTAPGGAAAIRAVAAVESGGRVSSGRAARHRRRQLERHDRLVPERVAARVDAACAPRRGPRRTRLEVRLVDLLRLDDGAFGDV